MMAEKENPSFVVRPHEDVVRGHGAFARPGGIKAGQVVLSEPPLLLIHRRPWRTCSAATA